MQRDFLEPGGFGAMLGNDVTTLQRIVPACRRLLALAREHGMHVIHTQEAHDPQLADCPPSKKARGGLSCGIGDNGPLGRVLVIGEAGADFVAELQPEAQRHRAAQAGQGRVPRHRAGRAAACQGHHPPADRRRDHRGLRADDDARGQRPRLRMPAGAGLRGQLLPAVPRRGGRDGGGAGRHRRLGGAAGGGAGRIGGRHERTRRIEQVAAGRGGRPGAAAAAGGRDAGATARPRPNASPGWWARRGATWARWTWWSSPSTRCTA